MNKTLVTKADLDLKIVELKTELVKRMLGIAAGQIAFLLTLFRQ